MQKHALFPAAGNIYLATFDDNSQFQLDFTSNSEMTYTVLNGALTGTSETVHITPVEIRPNVYMVYWREASQTEVVHVEDFEKNIVYTNITPFGQPAIHLHGTLTRIAQ